MFVVAPMKIVLYKLAFMLMAIDLKSIFFFLVYLKSVAAGEKYLRWGRVIFGIFNSLVTM